MSKSSHARDALLGKSFVSNHGEKYTVVDYVDSHRVAIKFEDGLIYWSSSNSIKAGRIINLNRITTCGRGFIGDGQHTPTILGVKTLAYVKWQSMFNRVYGIRRKANACYDDCSVDTRWNNFQTFAEWFTTKSQSFNTSYTGEICLDKDLLCIGSKEYSPDTCCLLPVEINVASKVSTGFYYDNDRQKFCVDLTTLNGVRKNERLGRFSNEDIALNVYSEAKDKYMVYLADKFKEYLSDDAYEALLDFNTKQRFLTQRNK